MLEETRAAKIMTAIGYVVAGASIVAMLVFVYALADACQVAAAAAVAH